MHLWAVYVQTKEEIVDNRNGARQKRTQNRMHLTWDKKTTACGSVLKQESQFGDWRAFDPMAFGSCAECRAAADLKYSVQKRGGVKSSETKDGERSETRRLPDIIVSNGERALPDAGD